MKVLQKAIYNQKRERIFLKSQNRFVPEWKHASTWLNKGCWDDDCELGLQVERTQPNRSGGNGIGNMARAYNILRNLGEEKFHAFCKGVNMPPGDKEAVLNKHRMAFNVNDLTRGIG